MIDQERALELKERLTTLENQLNQRIQSAEERIKVLGFGVRCFIKLDDKTYSFGYSNEDEGWGLYLRKQIEKKNAHNNKEYLEWRLASAPRAFRIACLEKIDKLEEALYETALKHADRLEKFLYGRDKRDSPLSFDSSPNRVSIEAEGAENKNP